MFSSATASVRQLVMLQLAKVGGEILIHRKQISHMSLPAALGGVLNDSGGLQPSLLVPQSVIPDC